MVKCINAVKKIYNENTLKFLRFFFLNVQSYNLVAMKISTLLLIKHLYEVLMLKG